MECTRCETRMGVSVRPGQGCTPGGFDHGAQEEDGPGTWEAFIYPLVFFFRASQRQPTGYRWERNKSRRSCGRSRH
jgi:hypothetical protein